MAPRTDHHAWTVYEREWLKVHYPTATWPELRARFPGVTDEAIKGAARQCGLSRSAMKNGRPPEYAPGDIALVKEFGKYHRPYLRERQRLRQQLRHLTKAQVRYLVRNYAEELETHSTEW